MFSAYLLVFWGRCNDVVHQNGYQFCYSMHACSECPVRGGKARGLSLGLGLVQPSPRYRVYDVEYSQFVCAGCFLEVGEKFLDEDGFILPDATRLARQSGASICVRHRHAVSHLDVGDTQCRNVGDPRA